MSTDLRTLTDVQIDEYLSQLEAMDKNSWDWQKYKKHVFQALQTEKARREAAPVASISTPRSAPVPVTTVVYTEPAPTPTPTSTPALGFNPEINVNAPPAKERIMSGKYPATCVNVADPEIYKRFQRYFMRVDFRIDGSDAVVSKYVNINENVQEAKIKTKFGPRSDYYKLHVVRAGGKPDSLQSSLLVGMRAMVTVEDDANGTYSLVTRVERLPQGLSPSGSLIPSGSGIHSMSH